MHRWLETWWTTRGRDLGALPEDPIARACCLGYDAYYQAPPPGTWGVEATWNAPIGGVMCAGTLDATALDAVVDGGPPHHCIVEHKTTSQDISPGSMYWRQVVTTDPQVSMYRAAFPGAVILYDVIRKPALRGKEGESADSLVARCLEAMAKEPEKYFQRAYVVRLESEDAAFADDVRAVDSLRRLPLLPRNPASCFEYGSRCGYYSVCWEGASLDGPEFRDQDGNR